MALWFIVLAAASLVAGVVRSLKIAIGRPGLESMASAIPGAAFGFLAGSREFVSSDTPMITVWVLGSAALMASGYYTGRRVGLAFKNR